MTRAEVQTFFGNWPLINFGGLNYAVPTLAWLQGAFWDFFLKRYWNDNLSVWKFRWECRDFARAYACSAQECNALTPGGPADCDALAVGEFWFVPDASIKAGTPAAGHAINACLTDHGLIFIDPQNNQPWPITPTEFASRYFVRF